MRASRARGSRCRTRRGSRQRHRHDEEHDREREPLDLLALDTAGSPEPQDERRHRGGEEREEGPEEEGLEQLRQPGEARHEGRIGDPNMVARPAQRGRAEHKPDEHDRERPAEQPEDRSPSPRRQRSVREQQWEQSERRKDADDPHRFADHRGSRDSEPVAVPVVVEVRRQLPADEPGAGARLTQRNRAPIRFRRSRLRSARPRGRRHRRPRRTGRRRRRPSR